MNKKSIPTALAIMIVIVFSFIGAGQNRAAAQIALSPMSGDQIRSDLIGQQVVGEYPNGASWAERFNPDGTTLYVELGAVIEGVLTLNGNIMCFAYEPSSGQTGGCFEVWKRGANCFDFYATVNNANLDQRRFGRAWSARAWIENRPGTCSSDKIS